MFFKFNHRDMIEQPKIELCKIDLEMIGYIQPTNLVIKPTFCDVTEVTFTLYKGTYLYDSVVKYMTLNIDGFGYFEIQDAKINSDGVEETKSVTAYSYEVTMNESTLTYKDNTVFKLWDALLPEKSLLGIISEATGWTINHVDGSLLNQYRTISFDNAEVYGALIGDIATAFKCYFVFDNRNFTISCYDRERDLQISGINLSFRNLIEDIEITPASDNIVTALTVTGAEGVGINLVNPIGNNVIYNYRYFLTSEAWGMPEELQYKVIAWQEKIDANRESYAELVLQRRKLTEQKLTLEDELYILKAELKSLQEVQSVAISGNNNEKLAELYPKIQNKENEISEKQNEIDTKENLYQKCLSDIQVIVNSLSLDENFDKEEQRVLKFYTKGAVYENENFVFTSNMTEDKKIDVAQQLYDQALKVFKKLSSPLYEFNVSVPGFMFNKDYEPFIKELELGIGVNLEIEDNTWTNPRILQVVLDYDNPENTTLALSDEFRLMNDVYKFSDKFDDGNKAARKTAITAPLWDEPNKNGFYTKVQEYIDNALNLANQEIINATNQEFTLGSYGLRGKKYIEETETYDAHQVAMTNNVLAFTDDNWQSCKAALGNITIGETNYYGLVAEAIVGNLIAGEQLTISNESNSFIVDGSGATLINADFSIENETNRIFISPTDGFKIQKKKDGTWEDVLSEDNDGVIVAKAIRLEESNIGGWTTTKDGLTSPVGDYINSDGTGKLSLLSWNNTSATFDGNIYANNLFWRYGEGDYQNIFVNGSMLGDWLTDNSVGKGKLNKVWVDEIDGLIAEFDEIHAKLITTEILSADYALTKEFYGGQIYVGDENNNTRLSSSNDRLSDTVTAYRMHLWARGGFLFQSAEGNTLGNVEFAPRVVAQKGITATDLIVSGKTELSSECIFHNAIKTEYFGDTRVGECKDIEIAGVKLQITNGLITKIE